MAEIYVSRLDAPGPAPVPEMAGGSTIGAALAGLAEGLSAIAQAAEQTRASQATTDYMTRLEQLATQFQNDTDYETASARFAEQRLALEEEVLGRRFTAQTRAALQTSFRSRGLTAQGAVDNEALRRTVDVTRANLDSQETLFLNQYLSASTDTQRASVLSDWDASIRAPVATGLIGEQEAVQRIQRRDGLLEEAAALEAIRLNPEGAVALLQDPDNFPTLTAVDRQRLITAAASGAEEVEALAMINRARFNPAAASLEAGTMLDPSHLELIFDGPLIGQESGGDAAAVSPAGALGIAQLMPGTARDMARSLGMADVAGLSDSELEERLLSDPVLNRQLGLAYFRQMAVRYEGNLPLMLAAYNAGPGRADRWRAEAAALYGPAPSPAQILSVIDIDETRGYVTAIYARAGANLDNSLSPATRLRTAAQIDDVIAGDQRAADQAIRDLASAQRAESEIVEILRSSPFGVADSRVAEYRRIQSAAAAAGDAQAAQELRTLDEAIAIHPFIQEAWRMSPADLDAAIGVLRADLARSGDVGNAAFRQLQAFEAVQTEIQRQAETDPVALGERAQLYGAVSIDVQGDFGSPGMISSLGYRAAQARAAASVYSAEILPFHPAEAAALRARWAEAQEADRLGMLAGMARAMPEDAYRAAVGQIAGDDPVGLAAGLVAVDRPELAREILRGGAYLSAPGTERPVTELRTALNNALGGFIFPPGSGGEEMIANAALALYVARRGANATLWGAPSSGELRDAIDEVAGEIVRRNGVRFPAPPGMTAGDVAGVLGRLTSEDLAPFGGAVDANGAPFDPGELGRLARLRALEPFGSTYAVLMPSASYPDGVPVMTQDGRVLVIDLEEIATGQAPRAQAADIEREEQQMQPIPGLLPGVQQQIDVLYPPMDPDAGPRIAPQSRHGAALGQAAAAAMTNIEQLDPETFQYLLDQLEMTPGQLIPQLAETYGVTRGEVVRRVQGQ